MTAADLRDALGHWASANVVGEACVTSVYPMPGNAGLSFGFDVADEAGRMLGAFVIRLSPLGVRRSGNTDVLRQVPLLEAAARYGIPIAELVWSSPDESWFGTDAIIQRRLQAKPLHMMNASASVEVKDGNVAPYLQRAAAVLADIHRVPWREVLPDWEQPKVVAEELRFWTRILAKSPEPQWVAAGEELAAQLAASDPGDHKIGLFHGDYQTNNILYDPDGSIAAVVDWEIAGIGATLLDLGWFSMMTDPDCWHVSHRERMLVTAGPDQIRTWYQDAAGVAITRYDWYRSYAMFKFACITTFNVRLHRTGRRVDPACDALAPSVETLFARARELARADAARLG